MIVAYGGSLIRIFIPVTPPFPGSATVVGRSPHLITFHHFHCILLMVLFCQISVVLNPGGLLPFYAGRLHSKVEPFSLLYTIFGRERYPSVVSPPFESSCHFICHLTNENDTTIRCVGSKYFSENKFPFI